MVRGGVGEPPVIEETAFRGLVVGVIVVEGGNSRPPLPAHNTQGYRTQTHSRATHLVETY